jgi:hypothetical protein
MKSFELTEKLIIPLKEGNFTLDMDKDYNFLLAEEVELIEDTSKLIIFENEYTVHLPNGDSILFDKGDAIQIVEDKKEDKSHMGDLQQNVITEHIINLTEKLSELDHAKQLDILQGIIELDKKFNEGAE